MLNLLQRNAWGLSLQSGLHQCRQRRPCPLTASPCTGSCSCNETPSRGALFWGVGRKEETDISCVHDTSVILPGSLYKLLDLHTTSPSRWSCPHFTDGKTEFSQLQSHEARILKGLSHPKTMHFLLNHTPSRTRDLPLLSGAPPRAVDYGGRKG